MSLSFYMRDFAKYTRDYVVGATQSRPAWLNFTKDIAKWTGHTKLLDLTTSYLNLEKFVFMANNWTIGGVAFDGIMKTDHTQEIKLTQYPVQTGAVMTDHAVVLPAVLDIEICVSDANPNNALTVKSGNGFIDAAADFVVKRFLTNGNVISGTDRAVSAWALLKIMAATRAPITVVTRLGTYQNMVITKLNAPDDVQTLYALRASIHLEEVQVASVSEVAVSARKQATDRTNGGAKPVSSAGNNKTALKASMDAISKGGA